MTPYFGPGWVPSADCLTLGAWAPPGARGNPVTVFVHGSGSLTASTRAALYDDGSSFARGGVALVTVDDRLGAAGLPDVYVLATQIRSDPATLVAQYRARHPRATAGRLRSARPTRCVSAVVNGRGGVIGRGPGRQRINRVNQVRQVNRVG
ncbi:carboxylesterase family protein [Streptomyces noursei]|uniref:carboxylesterase family protein n=1 Tax=Streptomyces noursei TaxID=1971 RepID=UPI00381166F0